MDLEDDPNNAGQQILKVRKVTDREVSGFDKYGNVLQSETKLYEIQDGKESLVEGTPTTLDNFKALDGDIFEINVPELGRPLVNPLIVVND